MPSASPRINPDQQADLERLTVGDYPGLRTLAWQTDAGTTITETETLNLYERGPQRRDRGVDGAQRLLNSTPFIFRSRGRS